MTKVSLVSVALLVSAGACAVACGSDDDSTSSTGGGSGGRSGAGGKSSAGAGGSSTAGKGASGGSAGSPEAGQAGEAGAGGAGGGSTLYTRLGGHDGIAQALDAIVTEELKDPIIASYFSQQANPAHKPTTKDIGECFTNLLGKAAGGPELYPFNTSSGFTCRDMHAAHATLGIGAGTFDLFVMHAATELTALNVEADDIASIADVLNGTKTTIVDPNVPSGTAKCASPASCSVPVDTGEAGSGGATATP